MFIKVDDRFKEYNFSTEFQSNFNQNISSRYDYHYEYESHLYISCVSNFTIVKKMKGMGVQIIEFSNLSSLYCQNHLQALNSSKGID